MGLGRLVVVSSGTSRDSLRGMHTCGVSADRAGGVDWWCGIGRGVDAVAWADGESCGGGHGVGLAVSLDCGWLWAV